MASVADFQTRFPEFCEVDDDRVQMFLDDVALIIGTPARWLGYYEVVHQYYTAHFLAVAEHTESGDSGVLAPVKQQEVDDVVVVNAVGDIEPTFDELSSTAYGKRVQFYRKICFTGMYGV